MVKVVGKVNELGLYVLKKEHKKIVKKSKMSKISQMMKKILDCCKE